MPSSILNCSQVKIKTTVFHLLKRTDPAASTVSFAQHKCKKNPTIQCSFFYLFVFTQAVLGHDDCVAALLECKASPLCRDAQGRTPLHYAASRGHTEILASLVQVTMATDPQDKLLDNKQYTPIHWAAYKGLLGFMSGESLNTDGAVIKSVPMCFCSQGMKTVWRFYLNLQHLFMKRETLSLPCTVLCEY